MQQEAVRRGNGNQQHDSSVDFGGGDKYVKTRIWVSVIVIRVSDGGLEDTQTPFCQIQLMPLLYKAGQHSLA